MEFSSSVEHGDVVQLVHADSLLVHNQVFVAERASAQHVAHVSAEDADAKCVFGFAKQNEMDKHLRILPNRGVDGAGGRGPWALFEVSASKRSGVSLRVLGHHAPDMAYLSASIEDGVLVLGSCRSDDDPKTQWFFHKLRIEALPGSFTFDPSIDLSVEDREHFRAYGYLILRNAIDRAVVDDALRCINHKLGKGPEAWQQEEADGKFKLAPSSAPPILALVQNTRVWTLVQRMLGRGAVQAVQQGQLAVRFPIASSDKDGVLQHQTPPTQWHVDGQGKGKVLPFSLLLKVALSDQTQEGNGNFTVFPGSHVNPQLLAWYARQAEAAVPATDRPDVGLPMQVCLAPGDAVLVHPYVAHCVGRNVSPHPRYSVIFRLRHRDILAHSEAAMQNPFVEFAGML